LYGADNKVTVHTLQLRGTSGSQWIVSDGLKDGDRVIVAGLQRVQPGALVEAAESTAASSTPASSPPVTAAPIAPADAQHSARRAVVAQAK